MSVTATPAAIQHSATPRPIVPAPMIAARRGQVSVSTGSVFNMESSLNSMERSAVRRRFLAVQHPVISDHPGHPQAVVAEYVRSPPSLCIAMRLKLPPGRNGLLIAPERTRQDLARLRQA